MFIDVSQNPTKTNIVNLWKKKPIFFYFGYYLKTAHLENPLPFWQLKFIQGSVVPMLRHRVSPLAAVRTVEREVVALVVAGAHGVGPVGVKLREAMTEPKRRLRS